jgi:hypothetical protein
VRLPLPKAAAYKHHMLQVHSSQQIYHATSSATRLLCKVYTVLAACCKPSACTVSRTSTSLLSAKQTYLFKKGRNVRGGNPPTTQLCTQYHFHSMT